MQTVKCFQHDSWIDTDVFELIGGDIFAHQGQTYVVKDKPYLLDGKPNVPAELYDSGAIVLNFSRDRDYIHMVMDFTCCSAQEFDDGSMLVCEFSGGKTNTYSPRLPVAKLNEFCKENIEHYEAFYHAHEQELESGIAIEMPKFWL